jgi:hypothetical protein
MKRQLPLAIIFIGGVFMLFQYFVPHETSEFFYEFVALDWPPIIGVFALSLGIISLARVSVSRINQRQENWQYSILTLVGLGSMLVFGVPQLVLFFGALGLGFVVLPIVLSRVPSVPVKVALGLIVAAVTLVVARFAFSLGNAIHNAVPWIGGRESPIVLWEFNNVMVPVTATMFAILAFFIASAAYRAFRARSILASVLLIAALIVMLRFFPLGPFTTPTGFAADWIITVPNLAAKRAIVIGVGLGIVATALKIVLGVERSYLGRD